MAEKSIEQLEAKIARLEEEKVILWTIIQELEVWMHGEGCFISARTKAKLEIARTVMTPLGEDVKRCRARLFAYYQEEQKPESGKGRYSRTPEAKAAHAERMRVYWAERRKQSSTA